MNLGTDAPYDELWQLNLSTGAITKMEISSFEERGDFGLSASSPNGRFIANTQESEGNKILRILDLAADRTIAVATTTGDRAFFLAQGLCSQGSVDWLDDISEVEIRYRLYRPSTVSSRGCMRTEPAPVSQEIIHIQFNDPRWSI